MNTRQIERTIGITPPPWARWTLPNGDELVGNRDKLTVCLAPEYPLTNGVKHWPANARLIVAAPDLLAQLKDIVTRFHSCCVTAGSDIEYADAAVANAMDAIARAEGDS